MNSQMLCFCTFEYNGITKTLIITDAGFKPLIVNDAGINKIVALLSFDRTLDKYAISGFNDRGEAYFPNEQLRPTLERAVIKDAKEIIFKQTPQEAMQGYGDVDCVDVYYQLKAKSIHTCAYFIEPPSGEPDDWFVSYIHIPPRDDSNIGFTDVDYVVIDYIWDDNGGRDLDTRSQLQVEGRDNLIVGWSRNDRDKDYIVWGNDNTDVGLESLLINIKRFNEDFNIPLKVSLSAFWFSDKKSGKARLRLRAYKGGDMNLVDYGWINEYGSEIQTTTIDITVPIYSERQDSPGSVVGYLLYDYPSQKGILTLT